jgi:transposase
VELSSRHAVHAQKKTVIASEQDRPDVAAARDAFFAEQIRAVPLDQIVVLDETYATTKFTRLRGRAPRQQRLKARVPHGHWKTLTVIAAITTAGVLASATVDAATSGEIFSTYVSDVLVPCLRPGMVVVMDNLSAHKVEGIREAIEGAQCRVVYLPPYSPDFSPIENIFSKFKQQLRTAGAREVPTLMHAIGHALSEVTANDCLGCFIACGYAATNEVKML